MTRCLGHFPMRFQNCTEVLKQLRHPGSSFDRYEELDIYRKTDTLVLCSDCCTLIRLGHCASYWPI